MKKNVNVDQDNSDDSTPQAKQTVKKTPIKDYKCESNNSTVDNISEKNEPDKQSTDNASPRQRRQRAGRHANINKHKD